MSHKANRVATGSSLAQRTVSVVKHASDLISEMQGQLKVATKKNQAYQSDEVAADVIVKEAFERLLNVQLGGVPVVPPAAVSDFSETLTTKAGVAHLMSQLVSIVEKQSTGNQKRASELGQSLDSRDPMFKRQSANNAMSKVAGEMRM